MPVQDTAAIEIQPPTLSPPIRAVPKVKRAVKIMTPQGEATFFSFESLNDSKEHFALGFGAWHQQNHPIVRLHSECLTGDVFKSGRCDCGYQLEEAITRMSVHGGLLLYLRQEGRGIGFYNKLEAYSLQDQGFDTFEANRRLHLPEDSRDYRVASEMLQALGVTTIQLLTNNPDKVDQLRALGVRIESVVPTALFLTEQNRNYLRAKANLKNHTLLLDGEVH